MVKRLAPAAFLLGTAVLVYWLLVPAPVSTPDVHKAPPLSGPGLDGKTVSLADFAGKVVLVDFWATWCDPCRAEIPELTKLQAELSGRGFAVLGASMDQDGADEVRAFAKKHGIGYPVLLLGSERPPEGWTVPGLPTAYLVGRDGALLKRYFGAKSVADVKAAAEEALAR